MMGQKNKVGMMMAVMMGKKPAKNSSKIGAYKKAAMPKVKSYSKKMK